MPTHLIRQGSRFDGHALAHLRQQRDMSRPHLASLVPCATETLWRLESGRTRLPRYELVEAIAAALDIDVTALFVRGEW